MISKNDSFAFKKYQKKDLQNFFSPRKGETKLGEVINNLENPKYIILGIQESLGPRANKGKKGAENGFKAFLNTFLNMQSNESLTGDNIQILGEVIQHKEEEELTLTVKELDGFIFDILNYHIKKGQIPIVIGGGHNNAFPLMHFCANHFSKAVNVVNFDAHADYRALEGRHSGNPFSYAHHKGYLEEYAVFDLHQRYNSQQILDDLRKDNHFFSFHEEYLMGQRDYMEDFNHIKKHFNKSDKHIGIELDLDAIQRMPSSAYTPVGSTISTARKFVRTFAALPQIAYLHLPEGAPQTTEEDKIVGKTLAYLVSDFIIAHG